MTHKIDILRYLESIYPDSATNSDIVQATEIEPNQQVFQKTAELKKEGAITGWQIGREWHFRAKEKSADKDYNPATLPQKGQKPGKMTGRQFEVIARQKLSTYFNTRLSEQSVGYVGKKWDMVSPDGKIIGDAKYYTLVRGKALPPAKFATIAEHVWLLEKTQADIKFLVFGNQIEVPQKWLEKYGNLVSDVKFYFLYDNGKITLLNE